MNSKTAKALRTVARTLAEKMNVSPANKYVMKTRIINRMSDELNLDGTYKTYPVEVPGQIRLNNTCERFFYKALKRRHAHG